MKNLFRATSIAALLLSTHFSASAAAVLGDVPAATANQIPFNLLFTLDNSGSMDWTAPSDPQLSNYNKNCFKAPIYNSIYYNPSVTYLPPRKADGTRYPNQSYTSASNDGYFAASSGTRNLSNNFGQYPNDDTGNMPTGTALAGTTYRGGYYYTAKSTASSAVQEGTACGAEGDYTRVNLNSVTATPTLEEQTKQTNFANWYSYYRTRMMSMKASVGEAFYLAVSDTTRVGFHTINNPGGTSTTGGFIALAPFTGTHKSNWFNKLYNQDVNGSTPLRAAEQRAGEYFQLSKSPATGSTITDPIQYACQRNYHMLSTDGYWNTGSATGASAANNDNVIPNNTELVAMLDKEAEQINDYRESLRPPLPLIPRPVKAGDPWFAPYREKPGSNSTNTLSDIATYFFATDLRSTMANQVPPTSRNKASWQHMVTYGISFGAKGSVPYDLNVAVNPDIQNGTLQWPVPAADSATAIDDLWHAAVNSRGLYANVKSPSELVAKVSEMLRDAAEKTTFANIGRPSAYVGPTGSIAYYVMYEPAQWTGSFAAKRVDAKTGLAVGDNLWDAAELLKDMVAGTGWKDKRKVITFNTVKKIGVPFERTQLSPAQQAALGANSTEQDDVIAYLRGDKSGEGPNTGEFRQRSVPLGDIVNADPVAVVQPQEAYAESFNLGYKGFRTAYDWRKTKPTVYVAANDGMLHAFDGNTGVEKWAYIPGILYRSGTDGLAALSYNLTDPLPKRFSHHFYVDQTPWVQDIDFSQTASAVSGDGWRTVLIGGLGKGGKGYYALDVTDPEHTSETAAAAKVLWEFTGEVANDPKMGYSFGQPLVVRTKKYGWVVLVSSGIGNGDGRGYLWVLHPKTGQVLHRFETPAGMGSLTSPLDMAHFDALVPADAEGIGTQVYAGDLQGNVYRFDISDPSSWPQHGVRIAAFGPKQPITVPPSVEYESRSFKRWVFVGTGRLLDGSDLANKDVQSFYVFQDGTKDKFDDTLNITRADLEGITPTGAASGTKKGWYIDLPMSGERIVKPFLTGSGVVVFGTFIPSTDPCIVASGNVFARSWPEGKNILTAASPGFHHSPFGVAGIAWSITNSEVNKETGLMGAGANSSTKLVVTDLHGTTFEVPLTVSTKFIGMRTIWRLIQED